MTRKDAIEAIKCNWPDSRYTILREALDMAVKALEDVTDKNVGKMTNADRIRSMSDEELAKAIFNWFFMKEHCDMCVPEMRTPKKCNGRCTSGILRWLQQPAKEDKHETD